MAFIDELNEEERAFVQAFDAKMNELADGARIGRPDTMGFSILYQGEVVPVSYIVASMWNTKYPDAWRVAKDCFAEIEVSTVFSVVPLGWLDFDRKNPQHFETEVSSKENGTMRFKYRTLKEAQEGHAAVVVRLRKAAMKGLRQDAEEV